MSKRKILLCIQDLSGGGAEKILVETVRKLDPSKYDITVLSLFDDGTYVEDIKQVCSYQYSVPMSNSVFANKVIKKLFLRIVFRFMPPKMLYKLCTRGRYDVEIAFLEGLATKVISGSTDERSLKYAWVHVDVVENSHSERVYLSSRLEREAYEAFDKILCVSMAVRRSFIEKIGTEQSRVSVQLNVLDESVVIEKSKQSSPITLSPKTLIAIGRLSPEKGFSMLLSVAVRLRREGLDFSLMIVGEGSERRLLEEAVKRMNLQGTVIFTGFIANPYPLITQADVLISSSLAEGFSTVVSEAIILGTPVVATDTAGMRDILGDSEYGLITPCTEEGLYVGLKRILQDEQYLAHLKLKAVERQDFFRLSRRIRELDELFFEGADRSKNDDMQGILS